MLCFPRSAPGAEASRESASIAPVGRRSRHHSHSDTIPTWCPPVRRQRHWTRLQRSSVTSMAAHCGNPLRSAVRRRCTLPRHALNPSSPWCAPYVVVQRRHGGWSPCQPPPQSASTLRALALRASWLRCFDHMRLCARSVMCISPDHHTTCDMVTPHPIPNETQPVPGETVGLPQHGSSLDAVDMAVWLAGLEVLHQHSLTP